jgi:hypothetical protein
VEAGCGYACGGPRSFMGRVGWVYVRGRCAVRNFFSLNGGFLPRSCCAFAHSQPFPFLEACFHDSGGPALTPRAKSRGVSLLGFSGPAAPYSLLNFPIILAISRRR